jgi:hypothetical protein
LLDHGKYGLTLFILQPIVLGGLASWMLRPASDLRAVGVGMLAVIAALGTMLLAGLEGLFCLVMATPLVVPLGALGSWLVYRAESSRAVARGGVAMLLLLPPASLTWDAKARPSLYAVTSSTVIAASPEVVWRHLVAIPALPEPREWYFRTGLAYPELARLEGAGGVGATRTCEFSTGRVVELIEIWDQPRVLRFRVTENPAPMREWSPYGDISPRHLHGYFISREGEFRLTPLAGNRTLLAGTSWYKHGLWPAQYWRIWSDAIVHRIHLRVFNQIRTLAEADTGR